MGAKNTFKHFSNNWLLRKCCVLSVGEWTQRTLCISEHLPKTGDQYQEEVGVPGHTVDSERRRHHACELTSQISGHISRIAYSLLWDFILGREAMPAYVPEVQPTWRTNETAQAAHLLRGRERERERDRERGL